MMLSPFDFSHDLPNDISACHQLIRQLREQVRAATSRVDHLEIVVAQQQTTIDDYQQTIENLSADNALLKRSLFGCRRERYTDDPAQKLLFDFTTLEETPVPPKDSPKDSIESPKKKRTSRGRQSRVFPECLPREEERFYLQEEEIPEEFRDHPQARRFFKKVSERLQLIPLQLKVIESFQEVIALDQPNETTQMITAQRPATLIQSFADESLLAYLTVSRFADHLPYYRLEDVLGRSGFRIHRSTQWRWMRGLAQGVSPLIDLMWERVLESKVLVIDETPIRELCAVQSKTLKGYLWAVSGDPQHPYDCFFYTSDRRSIHPQTVLENYQGVLVSDAYVAYEKIGELCANIINASCWAHARRKFDECHRLGATLKTHTVMAFFRQLFDIEDLTQTFSAEERLAYRQKESLPIVNDFYKWLQAEREHQLPKSKLMKAINYMLNRWETFTQFLNNGMIPIDNNQAERTLKYPILGRKAWLFVGSHEAGETAAKLFTLTKTCNRLCIDPLAYLQDIYTRLPTTSSDDLPLLLPDHWIKEHPEHRIQQRVQEALDRAQRTREQRAARRLAA